ncbi:5-formyltetrahydrofolate cyclo-ligase [Haloimpatiens sp. FM7330]|uniref:5-formyltetrahydrofolate cyclo-ligase n=1 Tax=Haloimpatiens sp. FM7330 TaxID=3298610 RepID=UPI00364305AA
MMDKNTLRKLMKEKRKNIKPDIRKMMDEQMYNNVINSNLYKNAKTIFIFVSYNNEVNTHNIIKQAIRDDKTLCVPKVISKESGMISIQINDFTDLEHGAYGILEPKEYCSKINPKKIDLAFVPGLAFDKNGGRIGYGGGFYDRFLKLIPKNCPIIGLGYKIQIIDEIPMDENDIKLNNLITD